MKETRGALQPLDNVSWKKIRVCSVGERNRFSTLVHTIFLLLSPSLFSLYWLLLFTTHVLYTAHCAVFPLPCRVSCDKFSLNTVGVCAWTFANSLESSQYLVKIRCAMWVRDKSARGKLNRKSFSFFFIYKNKIYTSHSLCIQISSGILEKCLAFSEVKIILLRQKPLESRAEFFFLVWPCGKMKAIYWFGGGSSDNTQTHTHNTYSSTQNGSTNFLAFH